MTKIVYLGILFLTVLGCKTTSFPINKGVKSNTPIANNIEKVANSTHPFYFKSSGTEPFWGLTISDYEIVFNTIGDSMVFPYIEPILALDANVKLYRLKSKFAQLNIQILQQICINSMSGNTFPYSVSIEYKKNTASEFEKVSGCGQYVTDYRLHDSWILEELNGKKISVENFSNKLPLIEINSNNNTFLGFAGCNEMNGSLFFEKEKLQFINLTITKMKCESSNKESEFITALQSTNHYQIENNRLILSNPSGIKIKFKKID